MAARRKHAVDSEPSGVEIPRVLPAKVGELELRRHTLALDRLFTQTRAELIAYFTRRVGNTEIAAEHAQETFLRFAKSGYRADGPDARAIIFGIARNLLMDDLRRRRRVQLSGFDENCRLDADSLAEVASMEAGPEEALTARQELERVLEALQELPAKCRKVFVMHRLHGRSHKDIAAELGITCSMVEKHIMEAVARLLKAKT